MEIRDEVDVLKARLRNEEDEGKVKQLQDRLSSLNSNWEWEGILKKQYGFKENEMNGILHNPKPYMVKTVGGKIVGGPGDVNNYVRKCHYTSMKNAVNILKGGEFWASKDGTWGAGFYICQYLPDDTNARDMLCMNSFGNVYNARYEMPEWKFRRDSGCCDVGIILCVPQSIVRVNNERTRRDERIVEKIGNSPDDTVTFSLESKDLVKEGEVIEIRNTRHFRDVLQKNKHTLIVIKFGASWCGPSNVMTEVFKKLAKKYRSCVFVYVDVDEIDLIAEEYSVSAMPTFVFLKKKNKPLTSSRIQGAYTEKLIKTVEKLANEHSGCAFPGLGYSLTGATEKKTDTCSQYRTVWADKSFVDKLMKPKRQNTQPVKQDPAASAKERRSRMNSMPNPHSGRHNVNKPAYGRAKPTLDLRAERRAMRNTWKCAKCNHLHRVQDLNEIDYFICDRCSHFHERGEVKPR